MIARLLKEFARNPKVVQSDDEILEKVASFGNYDPTLLISDRRYCEAIR
jgi:hypothetical protein